MTTARDVVTVMVADDHSLYRAGLRELLEEEEVRVVSEASNGEEAVREAARTHPNVVVMDVRMPVLDGIEASRRIKEQLPDTHIVMVTGVEEDHEQLLRAIDAGARSFVGKGEAPEVIVEAVRSAAHGEPYLRPEVVRLLLQGITTGRPAPAAPREHQRVHPAGSQRLTPREREVLTLLAEGKHNQDIAAAMGLSVRAVGNHLAKIYNKLHVHGRSEAVLHAIRSGVVHVDNR